MATMGKREVAGPVIDWLSKEQVCELLKLSRSTLDRLIRDGQFPRAVDFPGEDRARWRWVDVAWFLLGREVSDRLEVDPVGAEEMAAEASPGTKRGSTGTK